MSRKNYSEEFRRQSVELYESTPGATIRGIASDLGVVRGSLTNWVDKYGTGRKTAADGRPVVSPVRPRGGDVGDGSGGPAGEETDRQKIDRLEAENKALRSEQAKLTTEREILRKAAKYFAGETNW